MITRDTILHYSLFIFYRIGIQSNLSISHIINETIILPFAWMKAE